MQAEGIDCLLVTEGGALVGIFTDRDAILKVAGQRRKRPHVGEVMTHDPVILRSGDPVAVAIHKMAVGGFRHVPIVKGGDAGRAWSRRGTSSGTSRRALTDVSDSRGTQRPSGRNPRRRPDLGDAPVGCRERGRRGPERVRRLGDLEALLADGSLPFAIVDLTARAYDGVEAIRSRAGRGREGRRGRPARRRATPKGRAGRGRRARLHLPELFEDGPRTLGAWLAA